MAKATVEALGDSKPAAKRGLQLGIHHPGGDADDKLVADLQLPGTAVTQVIDKLLGARRHYDGFTQIARRMDPGILTQRQSDGDRTMKLIDDEQVAAGGIAQLDLAWIRIQILDLFRLIGGRQRQIIGVTEGTAGVHILVDAS